MKCPICESKSQVLDSRPEKKGIRRNRECKECLTRFTTHETLVIRSMDKHLIQKYHEKEEGCI
ncbi:hypothetical protein [Cytobacillus sp. IB215665]|uniref:NrdR family transcriptional regulator n=1 Tax=Cytobacillus sp. IB215665 TaxID=3097357 RepID=UPI002A0ABA24|nr:hypothetical protein [Cytobacillus sp. IB215665]MDX8367836.1 hypothetical protein [Cytobacillus sp. IB215665]